MTTFLIVLVVLLVIGSAFFSSAEIAYNSASRHKIRAKAEAGNKSAIRAKRISEHYTETLSTVLVGNNLVNIATTSVITTLAIGISPKNGQTYAELITTLILLIFGEIVPKILAAEYCNRLVLFYSAPLQFFMTVFKPVVWIVSKLMEKLSRFWTPRHAEPAITDEELVMVVDSIQDEGVITESESDLIKSAIEFPDIMAHEIMTPRIDVAAVDTDSSVEELMADRELTRFTLIPVYEETLDHIIGIVNVRELLKETLKRDTKKPFDWHVFLQEPKYVHMTKNISDLLKEMRQEGQNMAVVLDEFGGVMGIVTMEDILEEIVGDIFDETDEAECDFIELSENEFRASGDMNIYDVLELLDCDSKEIDSEYSTLGGWITGMLDRFPKEGDSFTYKGRTITVLSVETHRVETVKIERKTEDEV